MDKDKLYSDAVNDFENEKFDNALEKFITLYNDNLEDKNIFHYILHCIELSLNENIVEEIEKIKIDKNSPDGLYLKSFALSSIGDVEEAVKNVDNAINLDSNKLAYHLLKISELADLDKIEESERYINELQENNPKIFVKIILFNGSMENIEEMDMDIFEMIDHIDSFEDEDIEDFLSSHGGIEGLLNELESENIVVEVDDEENITEGETVIEINPEDIDENGNITINLDELGIELEDGQELNIDENGNLILNIDEDMVEEDDDEYVSDVSFPYQFVDDEAEELTMEEIQEALTIAHSQFRYKEDHSDYILSNESLEPIYKNDEEVINIFENYINNILGYVDDFISRIEDNDMVDFLNKNIDLIKNRKFDEALEKTNEFFLKNPDNKNIMIFKGFLYLLNFLTIEALYIINQIKDNEKIYDCMLIKALVCEAINHDLSYYYFEKTLELNDDDERVWIEYIIFAMHKEDMAKVEQIATKCKAKFPDFEMGIE